MSSFFLIFCVSFVVKLSNKEKAVLGGDLVEKKYQDGQKIICEGDYGDEFFLIKEVR